MTGFVAEVVQCIVDIVQTIRFVHPSQFGMILDTERKKIKEVD